MSANPSATSEDAIAEYIKKKYRAQHEAAQTQGLSAYLKEPPIRGRVNQRFLSSTLQAVAFENRQATPRDREGSGHHRSHTNQRLPSPGRSSPRQYQRHARPRPHARRSSRHSDHTSSQTPSGSPTRQERNQRTGYQRSYRYSPSQSLVRGHQHRNRSPHPRARDASSPRRDCRSRSRSRSHGGATAEPRIRGKRKRRHDVSTDAAQRHDRGAAHHGASPAPSDHHSASDEEAHRCSSSPPVASPSSKHNRKQEYAAQHAYEGSPAVNFHSDPSDPTRRCVGRQQQGRVEDSTQGARNGMEAVEPGGGVSEGWEFDAELQRSLQKVPRRGRGAVGSRVFDTGPFQEDDAMHAAHALRSAAQHVLLPGGGSSGRPIGGGLHAAGGAWNPSVSVASTSKGRGVPNERVVQLAKQLTDSGVPLEIATARAEAQVLNERKAEGKEGKEKKKKRKEKDKKEKKSRSKHRR